MPHPIPSWGEDGRRVGGLPMYSYPVRWARYILYRVFATTKRSLYIGNGSQVINSRELTKWTNPHALSPIPPPCRCMGGVGHTIDCMVHIKKGLPCKPSYTQLHNCMRGGACVVRSYVMHMNTSNRKHRS